MDWFYTQGGGQNVKEKEHDLNVMVICSPPKQKVRSVVITVSKMKHQYFTGSITVSVIV